MTSDAKRLINVFIETLSMQDQEEVLEFLNNYEISDKLQKSLTELKLLSEKRVLGPVSSAVCPFCGK